MPHTTNYISDIKLPNGSVYEIHDKYAIHDPADLGISGALIFKGVLNSIDSLPTAAANINGHVYLIDKSEYVCVNKSTDAAPNWTWEELGDIHDAASSTHTHNVTVTGTNGSSTVSGSATVTGTNSTSSVSGTASIANAPDVSASPKYAKVSTGSDTFVKSYPGASSKLVTTSIKPAGTATSVISSVTPATGSVTGVTGTTTASKATAGSALTLATRASSQTTVGNANVGSETTVATGVTGGSAASWSASVSNDGVLSFSFTPNTLQTATTTSITPATTSTTKIYGVGGTKSVTPYTFADVTVPVADNAASTFVTGVDTDTASVATVGTAVTVATGSVASSGAGSAVLTGLGTATTAKAITSASLAAGTSSDGIHTGDDVTIETQTLSGTISGTAAAQTWAQKTGTISGTAAAQTWTQTTGTTGSPNAGT